MRTRAILHLALGLGLAVVGCTPTASGPEWTGTLEERDGVVRATNPDEPLWPTAERPRLRLELEQTFGAGEEPAEAMLVQVRGAAADLDGNVYAIDQGDSQIVAFDRTGGMLWRTGRAGEGPGELHRPRRDDYWLAEASWPTNVDDPEGWLQQAMAGERSPLEYRRVLDLYDAEGRWLTGRVWDHPDAPEHG